MNRLHRSIIYDNTSKGWVRNIASKAGATRALFAEWRIIASTQTICRSVCRVASTLLHACGYSLKIIVSRCVHEYSFTLTRHKIPTWNGKQRIPNICHERSIHTSRYSPNDEYLLLRIRRITHVWRWPNNNIPCLPIKNSLVMYRKLSLFWRFWSVIMNSCLSFMFLKGLILKKNVIQCQ